jgi:hypothetical protein
MIPGFISVSNGGFKGVGYIDGTDPRHLTVSERSGIQVVVDFIKIVRKNRIPGLEECRLARVGEDLGIRETRHIIGDY